MMNDYWHIPRASLTSSAASSSAASLASSSNRSNRSSNSNPATAYLMAKNFAFDHREQQQKQQRQRTSRGGKIARNNPLNSTKLSPPLIHQTIHERSSKINCSSDGEGKRNSSSSQGSNKSNNSTRSAASGSLLLTAANLERFAEIHKKQEKAVQKQQQQNKNHLNNKAQQNGLPCYHGTNYNSNLVQAIENSQSIPGHVQGVKKDDQIHESDIENEENNKGDAIIKMDPNLDFIKTKNLDNISLASSMHFTMVNGEDGPAKKVKRGLCDRGRQVTVLIISMSTIFMFLIMGMVYALEMRAREMPKS